MTISHSVLRFAVPIGLRSSDGSMKTKMKGESPLLKLVLIVLFTQARQIMKTTKIDELKKNLKKIITEMNDEKKVVYIINYHTPVAALVPIKYAKLLEKLMETTQE